MYKPRRPPGTDRSGSPCLRKNQGVQGSRSNVLLSNSSQATHCLTLQMAISNFPFSISLNTDTLPFPTVS